VKEAYSGIVDAEFVNAGEISSVIGHLVAKSPILRGMSLTVAVPACFCDVHVETQTKVFKKPTKLTRGEIDEILNGGDAVYFKIDQSAPVIEALGAHVERELEAHVSHTEISGVFTSVIKHAGLNRYFKEVLLAPVVLCEARYLIDQSIRDRTCVFVSCKMFSTTVSVVAGDELLGMQTINMGSAHVVNDISLILHLGFEEAREKFLKYTGAKEGVYTIIKARLDDICEQILSIIKNFDPNLSSRPIWLAGGHVDGIKGGREILSANLGVGVEILAHPLFESNNADEASHDAVAFASV
jgi:Tfp pilus assembly PilM family ATPase